MALLGSETRYAFPFDQHFGNATDDGAFLQIGFGDNPEFETRDAATIDAKKVWMAGLIFMMLTNLKSPYVVTKLGAMHQTDLCQVSQISKDCRFVEPEWYQLIGEVSVSLRALRSPQCDENCYSRRGTSQ